MTTSHPLLSPPPHVSARRAHIDQIADRMATEEAGKKKRTATSGLVVKPIVPLEEENSLDLNGVHVVYPLRNDKSHAAKQIMRCADDLFQRNLKTVLEKPPDEFLQYKDKHDYVAAQADWNAIDGVQKSAYLARVDTTTADGMRCAFDLPHLRAQKWWKAMPGASGAFFAKALTFVKQGGKACSQGNLRNAWTRTGFGLWAHVVPDIGLRVLMDAMQIMEEKGFPPGEPGHFPHLIYKPVDGSALCVHHDQMASKDLLKNLREHVASDDASTTAWVRKHGYQMLAHLHGGTGVNDGATFVIGPMTPKKLLLCLEAYASGALGGDYEKWNAQPVGKVDLDVEKHLDGFNRVLANAGEGPIGFLLAAPTDVTDSDHDVFLLRFPVGFPHGSYKNDKRECAQEGSGRRLSVTVPITMRGSSQKPDPRIAQRLSCMAALAADGKSPAEYADARQWLQADTEPYAQGLTHKHPQQVADLISHPKSGVSGPLHAIAAKEDTVIDFLVQWANHMGK